MCIRDLFVEGVHVLSKKRFKEGFSLVEVMVAAAIMAGLALVVAQMMKNQKDVMDHSEAKSEELQISRHVRTLLANKDACEATFNGANLGADINEIKNALGNTSFQLGQKYGNRSLKLERMWTENLTVPASGGLGEAHLKLETERLKADNTQQKIVRDILIQVKAESSNGLITECYSDIENSIQTAKIEACESINGIFDTSTGQCDLNCISSPGQGHEAVSSECLDGIRADERQLSEDSYVNVSGDTMTGDLNVDTKVNANEFCLGGNCRTDFSPQSCAVGEVIYKVNASGSVECANVTCPSDTQFYVGIQSDGDVICKEFPTETCPTDHYVKKVNPDGSVECEPVPENQKIAGQDCATGSVVTGIATNGNLKCEPDKHVWSKTCPDGEYIQGFSTNGNPICKQDKNSENKLCSSGELLRGFDANGNKVCETASADLSSCFWQYSGKETGSSYSYEVCPAGHVAVGYKLDGIHNCWKVGGDYECDRMHIRCCEL